MSGGWVMIRLVRTRLGADAYLVLRSMRGSLLSFALDNPVARGWPRFHTSIASFERMRIPLAWALDRIGS